MIIKTNFEGKIIFLTIYKENSIEIVQQYEELFIEDLIIKNDIY